MADTQASDIADVDNSQDQQIDSIDCSGACNMHYYLFQPDVWVVGCVFHAQVNRDAIAMTYYSVNMDSWHMVYRTSLFPFAAYGLVGLLHHNIYRKVTLYY